ncbi:MAG: glycoside hydrolase family 32 protein [Chloroflexota bacterium]
MNQIQTRPLIHFTPPNGWMNDPNGLIYHNGEYHLFYQYYPDDLVWGPMHWGHAVSKDLIEWEHLPIALYPADDGWIFSGSAVIDEHNTAGFGAGAMVAVYSLHIQITADRAIQNQGIASSLDDGRTWTKYEGNPVISMPDFGDHNEFRDPKVDWYGTADDGHWVMVLAVQDEVWIYISPNLKDWELTSKFGQEIGCHGGVWECCDLFEMAVENSDESYWIMLVSVQNGAPAGGNGVQYFVGSFDGKVFTPTEANPKIGWTDYGPDFYAAVTFNNAPNNRRVLIGWMNNWPYSHDIPAEIWRGMQSVPRDLYLVQQTDDFVLYAHPVKELDNYWNQVASIGPLDLDDARQVNQFSAAVAEYSITFTINEHTTAEYFGMRVRCGGGQYTTIGYSNVDQSIYVDRSKMGVDVPKMFLSSLLKSEFSVKNGVISLNAIVDHESIEVWTNEGERYMTLLNYPLEKNTGFELFASNGCVEVLSAVCKTRRD